MAKVKAEWKDLNRFYLGIDYIILGGNHIGLNGVKGLCLGKWSETLD